jgi:hypothetical protein
MVENSKRTGVAVKAHYEFLVSLGPMVEKGSDSRRWTPWVDDCTMATHSSNPFRPETSLNGTFLTVSLAGLGASAISGSGQSC